MNYAVAFLGLILLASTVWWYASGKRYYTGPIVEAQAEDISESDGAEHTKDKAFADKDIV
jgi:hypothetical protein